MKGKFKAIACVLAAVAVLAAALVLVYVKLGDRNIFAMIPHPDDGHPYLIMETKGSMPDALMALLTDGVYAPLKSGTPRGALLAVASAAQDTALLIEGGDVPEVYAAFRFSPETASSLKKGILPESLGAVFTDAKVSVGSEKGRFCIEASNITMPIYYSVRGKNVAMTAEPAALRRMEDARRRNGFRGKKWTKEKDWPSHMEISDGGRITANAEHKFPLIVEAAWHKLSPATATDPAGEIRWSLVGLDAPVEAHLLATLKTHKWDISQCVIPEPLLLSAGFTPSAMGNSTDWPFPFSGLSDVAQAIGLKDEQINEILSSPTVFSLGGQNRILWFTLPGFLVEFSGRPELMAELVTAFWENLFFGAEPRPMTGFTCGGTTNTPFSVVGAGRDGIAVLGLTTPESISAPKHVGDFLGADEAVVAWLLADLPRIGGALSEMTRMSTFLEDEERMDMTPSYFDYGASGTEGGEAHFAEPMAPEISFSPFDQGISDAFGRVLKRMGRVLFVWENPLSGRINWYGNAKPQTPPQSAQ